MDGVPGLIRALLDPMAYPERPEGVELRQTHVSYLLFTPVFVYKIKKPVDFGFLDFTTLEKRRFYCMEEVRLNRRLAPDAYITVVPVNLSGGRYSIEGPGDTVEYAVKMRRLDEALALGRMILEGSATAEGVSRAAGAIAAFHAKAERGRRMADFGSIPMIRKNTGENFSQTAAFVGRTLAPAVYSAIKAYTESFIERNGGLFRERVDSGFIRDCHGDIHAEHVFMGEKVEIIDCIEFNERFRYSDTVADTAFLSMDLERLNRRDLSTAFDDAYFAAAKDPTGGALLDFYKCYRAYIRGKVEGFKAFEAEVAEGDRRESFLSAVYHYYLSRLYSTGGFRPMMLVVRGLTGTGKTVLSEGIAQRTGFVHLSSDRVRKGLAGKEPSERAAAPFGGGIYTDAFTERTYAELIKTGSAYLREGRSVVLDATFSRKTFLQAALEQAKRLGAQTRIIECRADDALISERLRQRAMRGQGPSDADWSIYLRQKAAFEDTGIDRAFIDAGSGDGLREAFQAVFR